MKKQTADIWFKILNSEPSKYPDFYKEYLGHTIKSEKLFDALERFGSYILFQSIVAASNKVFTGDSFNYVLAIAVNKTEQQLKEKYEADIYEAGIEEAKKRTLAQNKKMEAKLERAREIENVETK